jgi:hypothetical protein
VNVSRGRLRHSCSVGARTLQETNPKMLKTNIDAAYSIALFFYFSTGFKLSL